MIGVEALNRAHSSYHLIYILVYLTPYVSQEDFNTASQVKANGERPFETLVVQIQNQPLLIRFLLIASFSTMRILADYLPTLGIIGSRRELPVGTFTTVLRPRMVV